MVLLSPLWPCLGVLYSQLKDIMSNWLQNNVVSKCIDRLQRRAMDLTGNMAPVNCLEKECIRSSTLNKY